MISKFVLILACIFSFTLNSIAKENNWVHSKTFIKVERFILENQTDSALILLNTIPQESDSAYINLLTEWCTNKNRTNKTLYSLIKRFINVIEFRDPILNRFIEKHIILPKDENQIDYTYFHIRVKQMNILFDLGKIQQSDSVFQYVSNYIDHFENLETESSLAEYKFQENRYLLMLAYIGNDIEEFERIYHLNLNLEKEINSAYTTISNKKHLLDLLFLKQDLDKSILTAEDLMEFHQKNDTTTIEYYSHHFKLIDMLIFKSERKPSPELEQRIYNLLLNVYNSPFYQMQRLSLGYMVQFYHAYSPNSIYGKQLLELQEVNSLPELCQKHLEQVNSETNQIRITTDYGIISKALEKNGYLKESINLLRLQNRKLKEKYTNDLSNSIANLKVKQEQERNKHTLQLEKSKQNYYLLIVLVLLIILGILYWASSQQKKKNQLLAKKEKEKTLLLKEIHHRVKNNFQIAIGLIDLQFKDITDHKTLDMLDEWKGKIKSMIIVHQNLYKNDDLSVDLNVYIKQILDDIIYIYSTIKCTQSIKINGQYELDVDTAVNLGLILNELINNAFKYGVIDNSLQLHIECKQQGDQILLHFYDQGNGFKDIENINQSQSFGIKLITQLSKQINGKVSYENKNGAHFYITFNPKVGKN